VNCLAVRDILPEFATGVASAADRREVERHLRWCAGCRKESSELEQAAATFGFTLAPAAVPEGMGERVVERIHRASGSPRRPHRLRTAAAGLVAAAIAVSSLGWGAVMAGRADRSERRAREAQQDREEAIQLFQQTLAQLIPGGEPPSAEAFRLAQLAPTASGQGGGFVLQLVSPTTIDFTMVIVNGLDTAAVDRLPYRVQLFDGSGQMLRSGRIDELDADGGGELFRQFANTELTGYVDVVIVDASGRPVLTGTVHER
jgi:hypothetical protein